MEENNNQVNSSYLANVEKDSWLPRFKLKGYSKVSLYDNDVG
jgi:hypothetical protein